MSRVKLDEMIEQALAAERKERQEQEQRRTELLTAAWVEIERWMGQDIWDILSPYITRPADVRFFNQDSHCEVEFVVRGDELKISDLRVHWCPNYRGGNSVKIVHGSGYQNRTIDWARILLEARESLVKYQAEAAEKEIKEICRSLDYKDWMGNKGEDSANQALDILLERWPERLSEWDAKYKAWRVNWEKDQREKAERDAERAERKAVLEVEKCAIHEFAFRWLGVLRHNQKILAALQERYEETIEVKLLTYGVVSRDDDGETYIEQEKMYVVLAGERPGNNFLRVPSMKPIFVYHPIRLDDEVVNTEEEHPCVKKKWVSAAQSYLRYSMWKKDEDVAAAIERAQWQAFPEDVPGQSQEFVDSGLDWRKTVKEALKEIDCQDAYVYLGGLFLGGAIYEEPVWQP